MKYCLLICVLLFTLTSFAQAKRIPTNGRIPIYYECQNTVVIGKNSDNCTSQCNNNVDCTSNTDLYASQDWICKGGNHSKCLCKLDGTLFTDCKSEDHKIIKKQKTKKTEE